MHEISIGAVSIKWLGHASFMILHGSRKIYIDPFVLPDRPEKADTILVTHEHFDHFDADKISKIMSQDTKFFAPDGVIKKAGFGSHIRTDKTADIYDLRVEAVEAYNTNKFRSPGQVFHPHGLGLGFVLEIGGSRIYHAGDTDNIPEMKNLKNIDVALLPVGGTYTMTVQEAAEAAKIIRPKFLVPMHYNSDRYGISGINTNPADLAKALIGKGIVVNILSPLI